MDASLSMPVRLLDEFSHVPTRTFFAVNAVALF